MKISFFSAFWSNNNHERLRNVKFSSEKINELVDYLYEKGIDCNFTLFDFSEKKQISDSVHFPYDPNSYDRSKKMNMCIKYLMDTENPELICQFDSDIFVDEKYYQKFFDLINNTTQDEFYIAQVHDISDMSLPFIDFNTNKIDTSKLLYSVRNITGLGAVFLTKTSNIVDIGGFDERFEVWGGEDDDLADRLMRTNKKRKSFTFSFYHLPHKSLGIDIEKNPKYVDQVRIWKNDKTNKRSSFLNGYESLLIEFDAIDLITPKRFDINAKLYFAKNKNYNTNYPKELYLNHIRVWNNFFEDTPRKTSGQDFIDSFNLLLESVKTQGFINSSQNYIPLKNKSPYNGAHRVAASIVNNKKVYGMEDTSNGQYDCGYKFFRNKGLKTQFMDSMALEYVSNKTNLFTVSIFASDKKDLNQVEEVLSKYSEIVYDKEITLTDLGKLNYTVEIYRDEKWIGTPSTNYDGAKYKSDMCFQNSNKMKVYLIETKNPEKLIECKKEIRDFYKVGNHSVHINDTQEETWRISTILFNGNSIDFINKSRRPSSENLSKLLIKYYDFMGTKNKEDYCITSSSILTLYGLSECNDIDFLTLDNEYKSHNNDLIGSHENQLKYYSYSKDDMILNPELHFYYGGYKFVTPKVVYEMKKNRGEDKDKIHIELLKNIL
jgi:hypothetical protein